MDKIKKSIILLMSWSLAFYPLNVHAGDKVRTSKVQWKTVTATSGFMLGKYLTSNGCPDVWGKQVPLVRDKNPNIKDLNKLEIGDEIEVPVCKNSRVVYFFEEDTINRTNKILQWENVVVPNGFILSAHLYYNNHCLNIWDKQIPEFMKVNPGVKNPDNIRVGKEIKVQKCLIDKQPVIAKAVEKQKVAPVEILDEHRFEVFGGIFKEDGAGGEFGLGLNVLGTLSDNLGYRMFIVGAPSAAIYFANAEFRTKPAELRYYLSAGLGQRIGLSNSDEDRIESGVDSFVHTGVGLIYQPKGTFYLKLETGLNIAPRFSPNIEISGMKKFDSFWLGGFIQLKSTRSIVDNDETGRGYIFTGLKLSY